MEQVNEIRRMAASGYRQSEISRATGYDAKTVRKYLGIEDYSPKVPVERHGESKLDEYKPTIDKWLDEDERNWRKQRHTAKKVYERLRDEHGCEASYSVVQRYMKGRREGRRSKANLELQWEAGSAQVDFGEADFNEAGCKERRKYLTVSFPYSNTGIPQVFGGETSECVCEGLDAVFWKLGGVPPRIVFDNATGVGRRMGEVIRKAKLFEQFQAHYRFEARFCNPYAGYEKGNVENKVGYIRSNLFVPIPSYESMEEYNLWLLDVMDGKAGEAHYKKHRLIGELFKDDVASLHALPGKRFNVCRYTHMRTDGYGKVCLDGKHHYSTRPELAVSEVIVGIRAHTVEILTVKGEHVVTHRRNYGSLRTDTLDHSTSVAQLMRSAGAWSNSGLRHALPSPLREYMDSQSKTDLRCSLALMDRLKLQYGWEAAVEAMSAAVRNGSLNHSDAAVLAARLTGYGIAVPPSPGPDLGEYDSAFLRGGAAI